MIEHSADPIALVDRELRILYVSSAVEHLLGRTADSLVGLVAFDEVHPDDRPKAHAAAERALEAAGSRAVVELRVRHADGGWRSIEATLSNQLDDPAVGALVVSAHDVTERAHAVRALAESERRFRLIAENAHDVIARYQVFPERRTDYISPSVERLIGYSPEEFYADPDMHHKLIHPDDQRRLMELIQAGSIDALRGPHTLRWIHKDGRTVWMEQILVPVTDDSGNLIATETISRDVTEKIQLEEQLRQGQKMEALGRLAGGVAHDFNNLLGIALGSADVLRRRLCDNPEALERLDAIREATARGADLTRQLLAFSRQEVVAVEVLAIDDVLEELCPMLRRLLPEHIEVRTQLRATASHIAINRSQLEQIILNLAVNARDAMPSGGTLTIETSARGQRTVELRVRDTGTGMTERQREHVFEPFYTTKESGAGSGLGLAVVYGIVLQSGGRIDIDSAPNEGTAFEIEWPAAERPSQRSRRAPTDGVAATGSETILVVEDEAMLRRLVGEMLAEHGYRVLIADDADTALRLSNDHDGAIDLLLTDVVMPDLSGRELADHLVARQPSLRVLFMSGYPDSEILSQGIARDQIAFLPKPFSFDQLTRKVRETLDASP